MAQGMTVSARGRRPVQLDLGSSQVLGRPIGPDQARAWQRGGWLLSRGELHPDVVLPVLQGGRGQMVLVTGERGTGRSRCAAAILDYARSVSDVVVVAPGRSASLARLVRAIARLRPGGAAARLAEEITAEADDGERLAEELALVLVSEASQHPITVLVDDVHLDDEDTYTLVDHLLTMIGTAPLLLVVTAAGSWRGLGPQPSRWQDWIGHHAVLHVPVQQPPQAELVTALRQVYPGEIPRQTLESVLTAARGNARLAQEIALWTLNGGHPDDVAAGSLVREWVAAHEQDRVLGVVAVAGTGIGVRLIASITSAPSARVRQVLARACRVGLVTRTGEAGCGQEYAMAHPMFAAAAQMLLGADGVAALHEATATALAEDDTADASDDTRALDIARHLIASGRSHPVTARWCLQAASWCEGSRRLLEAVDLARAGLDADPSSETGVALARTLARCCLRLGDPLTAERLLRTTLKAVWANPELAVQVGVDLLELLDRTAPTVAASTRDLLTDALEACPSRRVDLRVRLHAIQAAHTLRHDPFTGWHAARRVLQAAESVGDESALTRALAVSARALMEPAHVHRLEEVAVRLLHHSSLDGLAPSAAAALARADRAGVDFTLREYTWRERVQPDQRVRQELILLGAGLAALEGREAVLRHAGRQLSSTAFPSLAAWTSMLPLLWTITTGGHFRPDAGLPRADEGAPGEAWAAPLSPLSEPMAGPIGGPMAQVHWLGSIFTRADALHPAEIRLIRQRLGAGDELTRPRGDGTWSVRLAAAARFAALTRDRNLSAQVVQALAPFMDQFVVLGPFLPVGPVGWFLIEPLHLLGRTGEAMEALDAAQRASRGLGALGWSLRLGAARYRYQLPDAVPDAQQVIEETIGPAAAQRFPALVAWAKRSLHRYRATEPGCAPSGDSPSPGPLPGPPPGGMLRIEDDASEGRRQDQEPDPAASLTPRDTEIMVLAANGCTNHEIARRLFLSVATVERRCTSIYRRLGVRNRAQALSLLGNLGPADSRA